MSARTVPALLVPTARAMPWALFLIAAGLGLVIVVGPAVSTVSLRDEDLLGLLRAAAACGAVGIAFLLDDPAARSIATAPTPRLVRHLLRAFLAVAAAGAWWAALLVATVAGAEDGAADALPLWGVSIEAASLTTAALALAAAWLRRGDGAAGVLAGPGVLVLAAVAVLLPARWALYVPPDDTRWAAAHDRWTILLVAALVALLWGSHDPVRGRGRGR